MVACDWVMKSDNQNKIGARRSSGFSRMEKVHPAKMLLYLCLVGVGLIFMTLLIGFLRTEANLFRQLYIPFPKFFSISTVILIFSSFTFSKVPRLYRQEKLLKMSVYLFYTWLLGFAFVVSQLVSWFEMSEHGIFIPGKSYSSYLYLISGLHILHLLGGILFLTYAFIKTRFAAADPVRTLIYIRDPYRELQITLLSTYWHFMDGLWTVIFLVFLFWF
jgi:cytochrome c oxidase subunit 3